MSNWPFVKAEPIRLHQHAELAQTWIHDQIAGDPAILGLGELKLTRRGAAQGELVLERGGMRLAVLVKTGGADETQFVAALECWRRESKTGAGGLTAVLVAEQIESRFLDLMPVLAGAVPMLAIQMQAIRVGEQMTVIFTNLTGQNASGSEPAVATEPQAAPVEAAAEIYDRGYWEGWAQDSIEIADELLGAAKALDPEFELDYREGYIGLAKDGQAAEFLRILPEAGGVLLGLNLEHNSLIELSIAQAGLERLPGETASDAAGYRIRLARGDMETQLAPVAQLLGLAYEESRAL